MSTLSPPLLPDLVPPPNRAWRRRNSTLTGAASSNGPRSMGSVMDDTDGPGQVIASACGSLSSTRSSNRLARSSGVGRTRAAPRNVPSPDSMAGSLAITSLIVCPRASANLARQPHTSITADWTRDPARPTAWAISGQALRVRSTLTLARRRRCAHHGVASTMPPISMASGSGERHGAAIAPAASQPPAAAEVVAA
jgi:hypothetical protein